MRDWRHDAACLEACLDQGDPELFFPIGDTAYTYLQVAEAKAICEGCKVREACLDWAVDHGQDSGIWGGLTEDERRALKRRATTPLGPVRDWID